MFLCLAEQCDIPPPPPSIINSASRQHVQIQQGGGLCGNRHRINPFSMKATRAAQGTGIVEYIIDETLFIFKACPKGKRFTEKHVQR